METLGKTTVWRVACRVFRGREKQTKCQRFLIENLSDTIEWGVLVDAGH